MKIYTKTGDKGTTGLWGGKRVRKSDQTIEALGAIDELVAWLGTLKLSSLQADLMVINSVIAGNKNESRILNLESRTQELERKIDRMQAKLPELHNFILPQNNYHIARAVCRRAERAIARLQDGKIAVNSQILKYLNRLSDYLFVLARYADFKKGKKELIWNYENREVHHKIRRRQEQKDGRKK